MEAHTLTLTLTLTPTLTPNQTLTLTLTHQVVLPAGTLQDRIDYSMDIVKEDMER